MCMSNGCHGKGCTASMICKFLLIVGGLNWGLVGVGMFMGSDLNVVHMILGSMPTLEGVVYVLVGIAAVMKLFGCKCGKCMTACGGNGGMEGKM